jgi:hypothetical protein
VKLMSVASRLIHQRSRLIAVCVMANLVAAAPAVAQSGPERTEAAPAASVIQQNDDAAPSLARGINRWEPDEKPQ